MRTRRSPRNQDRLFRELFKPAVASASASVEPITRGNFAERTSGWGRADKTRVLKSIERDELRERVRSILAAELALS